MDAQGAIRCCDGPAQHKWAPPASACTSQGATNQTNEAKSCRRLCSTAVSERLPASQPSELHRPTAVPQDTISFESVSKPGYYLSAYRGIGVPPVSCTDAGTFPGGMTCEQARTGNLCPWEDYVELVSCRWTCGACR